VKAGVLGAGMMGSVIARDLIQNCDFEKVVIFDAYEERLRNAERFAGRNVDFQLLDVRDEERTSRIIGSFDVVASALPHGAVHLANKACIKAGGKMVDIAFEDAQMELNDMAVEKNALIIPGCGLAPGLGGILLANAANQVKAYRGRILVGGLPQKAKEPFFYRLLFSIVGLIREYTEDARIIRRGKIIKVKPFEKIMKFKFPRPVGTLEGFYTDGLATLLYTMKEMDYLEEITLRWPGHAKRIKFLIDAGFFDRDEITVKGNRISPYEFTMELLKRKLDTGDPRDMTVMRVDVMGREEERSYYLVDFYDEKNGITSMARITGYTCSIVASLVAKGLIRGKGVLPPESAVTGGLFDMLFKELSKRSVRIEEHRKAKGAGKKGKK
jgi:lysine 6-dehydrogenase